jgi:DNA-binding response OmpR family regulator
VDTQVEDIMGKLPSLTAEEQRFVALHALLLSDGHWIAKPPTGTVISVNGVEYNKTSYKLTVDGEDHSHDLTPTTRVLLLILMENAGSVVPREDIAEVLWPGVPAAVYRQRLDMHVGRIRRLVGHHRVYTVHAVGYRFETGEGDEE